MTTRDACRRGPGRREVLLGLGAGLLAGVPRPAAAVPLNYPATLRFELALGPIRVPFLLSGSLADDGPKVMATMARYLGLAMSSDAPVVLASVGTGPRDAFARDAPQMAAAVNARARFPSSAPAPTLVLQAAAPGPRAAAVTIATYAAVLRWRTAMAAGLAAAVPGAPPPTAVALDVEGVGIAFAEALLSHTRRDPDGVKGLSWARPVAPWQTAMVSRALVDAFGGLRGTAAAASAANLQLALGYDDVLSGRVPPQPAAGEHDLVTAANAYAEQSMLMPCARALWGAVARV